MDDDVLDQSYATVADFIAGRATRSDHINHDKTLDDIDFHFNKPPFDIALIITDKSLISKISEFQIPLQSDLGFTTHVIFLPDTSRLKFCIKDLKLHEILYAIVINENSKENDDYDVFILSDIIEHQMQMQYNDVISLINADWENYCGQLKQLMSLPERSPHPDNAATEGFIAPSSNIRYLLCLLADHRRLELSELQLLRTFLKSRKDAINNLGEGSVNYGLNNRPQPSYQEDKFKYYEYERKHSNVITHEPFNHHNQSIEYNTPVPQDVDDRFVSNPSLNSTRPVPIKSYNVPSASSSVNTFITEPSQSYGNVNLHKKISNFSTSQSVLRAPSYQTSPSQSSPSMNVSLIPPGNNQRILLETPSLNQMSMQSGHNLSHRIMPPPPPLPQQINLPILERPAERPISFQIRPNVHVGAVRDKQTQEKLQMMFEDNGCEAVIKTNPISRTNMLGPPMPHNSSLSQLNSSEIVPSPVLRQLPSVSSQPPELLLAKDIKVEIDLTEEVFDNTYVPPAPKIIRYNSPPKTIAKFGKSSYVVDLATEYPTVRPKHIKMSSHILMNLFKFVLNMSPLSLPNHCEVLRLVTGCISEMEKFMMGVGLDKVVVSDVRACRNGGCEEIIRIIETWSMEKVLGRYYVMSDLRYMWINFPKNLSPDNVNILFYKLMKMLELAQFSKKANDILLTMIQKLEGVVNYNFTLSDHNSSDSLNCFPSLFKEFYDMRTKLRDLSVALPRSDPAGANLNTGFDKIFLEHKIKFVLGPLMEYFTKAINSIHYQLEIQTMEDIFVSFRTLRFCIRKIYNRLEPQHLPQLVPFTIQDDIMARTMELHDEIKFLLKEVRLMNCILFTKKHYDFVNLILDFAIKIEKSVVDGTDSDVNTMDLTFLVDIDPVQYLHDFSINITTEIFPYHHDTEIEVLKRSLMNKWIDALHQALKGVPPEPDGSRISKEISYLLPNSWGKHTFDEAVIEAANLCHSDWDRMLNNDFLRARITYSDVRNNYLKWLFNNGLDHKKAMELMTASQKQLDSKIMSKYQ